MPVADRPIVLNLVSDRFPDADATNALFLLGRSTRSARSAITRDRN